jgi:hypothetical protein
MRVPALQEGSADLDQRGRIDEPPLPAGEESLLVERAQGQLFPDVILAGKLAVGLDVEAVAHEAACGGGEGHVSCYTAPAAAPDPELRLPRVAQGRRTSKSLDKSGVFAAGSPIHWMKLMLQALDLQSMGWISGSERWISNPGDEPQAPGAGA